MTDHNPQLQPVRHLGAVLGHTERTTAGRWKAVTNDGVGTVIGAGFSSRWAAAHALLRHHGLDPLHPTPQEAR